MTRAVCALFLILMMFSSTAQAERIAVVNVERIFRESAAGKAGEAHIRKVQDILQKGMNDLQATYRGKENTPEGAASLGEGRAALERKLAVERQAVLRALTASLEKAINDWVNTPAAKQRSISVVAPSHAFFFHHPSLDVTDAIMPEMNRARPAFPPLPTVNVRAGQSQASASSPQSTARQRMDAPQQTASSALAQGEKQHVVQSGETLFRIGARYNVSPGAIMNRNSLPSISQIENGQVLIIPAASQ